MNILIFSQYYDPEPFLINEIAPELVKRGHAVTVVTGLPNYPSGVIDKAYRHQKRRYEVIGGVEVIRCPIVARGHNKIQLLINYFSYMFSANRVAKRLKRDFDVVVSYQLTPIFQVYPAIRYARKKHLKLLLYNLDLAPMCGEKYAKNKAFLLSWYAKFSKWAMNACDHIAVTSQSFIDYNHEVNEVPIERMTYLPQHASMEMMDFNMEATDNGLADFMFAGNIGSGMGADTIVEAAVKLKRETSAFKIHIVGDGSYLPRLKEQVASAELSEYFIFHGRYPISEMPRLYRMADALLITLRPGQITVPAKLQAYMTTKKPIFGAMDGSGKEVIRASGCGVCVNAGDSDALCEVMKAYIVDPEAYRACGERGLEYFKSNFTLDIFIHRFTRLLSDLSKSCESL